MLRILAILCLMFWGVAAQAQFVPSAPAEDAAAEQSAPGTPSTEALIQLLRDDAAREALISQLEAGAAATGAAAGEAEAAPPSEPERPTSVGRQIAEFTTGVAQGVADQIALLLDRLQNLPRTLSALGDAVDPGVVTDALVDLAFVIAVTYAAFLAFRVISWRMSRRLARPAETRGWLPTAGLNLLSTLTEVVVVLLAYGAGYLLTLLFYNEFGVIQIRQSLYLNAFLTVEMAKVIGRALLAPRYSSLRLISIPDAGAQSLWRWLSKSTTILGYGLLLAVPIVNSSAGYFAGASLNMAISAAVVLYTTFRVVRARRPVAQWLHKDADGDTPESGQRQPILAQMADLWHWPVLVYLLVLLAIVLARPGDVLLPMLKATSLIVATVVIGMMAVDFLRRTAAHGVRLPGYLSARLPLLEKRVNGLVPQFLLVIRLIVIALVIAMSLNFAGLWDFDRWLSSDAGSGLVSALVSVFLIVFVAFLVWLALASWVEFRLNPYYGRPPSSRETTLLALLRNAATIAILVLTLMFTLSELGLDIAPLLASAGVLGLAIGFGAQKMVQDIITGIFIQFENAMNVGDVVTVGGITGTVEKLTVRSVSLRDVSGTFHIIPFSSVDLVSNFMRDFSYFVADIGVAYREDIEMAKAAMMDAFEELRADPEQSQYLLGDLEWFGLNSFGDSAIVLRARIKTLPGKQWGVGRAYNLIIKRIFDERSIEIPFPHQTIYFGEDRTGRAPALHIRQEPSEPGTAEQIKHKPSSTE
ncbi:mechanosensitive ion channel [Halovulum dunhuangense]|uniref:Mechanosensitive ion channel n=1 Tax=Halovulum dunhuangense TaxID=1505036 RepID=A0A849KQ05_9RHOB|nr:mechanosensitive ion channel domain-containing protein [Halovulum dunhuangense]NNU79143.1 mechanosensitive ion channel [Halovulum dunhuangense]